MTMKTGAINAGIARVVASMAGREKLMIPILMIIFALGGTTYGMAEETLAFYPLIIPVMIAGYDALVGASAPPRRRYRGARVDDQPVLHRHRLRVCRRLDRRGSCARLVILVVGLIIGIVFVMRYAEKVRADPSQSLVRAKGGERGALPGPASKPERSSEPSRAPQGRSGSSSSPSWP